MYDVVIIGAGPAGYSAAYELSSKNKNLKILIIEEGNSLERRKCNIDKTSKCTHCKTCNVVKGIGGAGAFSDGKFNITTEFGGWLNDYISDEKILELINYVDSINVKFGATEEVFSTQTEQAKKISKIALANDLHLMNAKVKHLGTEKNLEILNNIFNYLKQKVTIWSNIKVRDIQVKNEEILLNIEDFQIQCKNLIVAPGRSGSEWFSKQCIKLGIPVINNQVDIGVRVEVPSLVLSNITDNIYEAKLKYRTKAFGDIVRTFCMNPNGYVVTENVDGVQTVNGHSFADMNLGSNNTNFALLVSNKFTEPFNDPYQYGKRIASFSNLLADGVMIQRFGDLVKGRRTDEHRLSKSFTKPTLTSAKPGDLNLVLPRRHLDNIIEMMFALDKIAPGIANYDTLLYGVEVKFYSSKPVLSNCLETKYKNFFAIGDGAGVTRGLAQAAASGILVAREILSRQ